MSIEQQNEARQRDGKSSLGFTKRPLAQWVKALAVAGVAASPLFTGMVMAQDSEASAEALEEITVTGTRKLIQDQIAIKRDATTIVDGLSASDIGELPALSIGEALESITGVASHRENGGASEITIRGLGPFLSATNFNGREATNGSGDRSVNFSQFPSELMSKVAVAKTQDASMIEGGVAGVIMLETLKPLEYGKQRVTVDAKLNYNPDEANVNNSLHDELGYRGTFSYVDQFEFGDGQAIGISIGAQQQSITQPEAEYRSSDNTGSSLWACLNDPTITDQGFFRSNSDDCENLLVDGSNVDTGYNTSIDPNTGKAVNDGSPYAWAGSSRTYRQNETSDERDSLFFAVQYQPSEAWDINFDAQVSDRIQAEERHDFVIFNKRATAGVTGSTLLTNSANQVIYREGQDYLGINGEKYNREENYLGYGLNVAHNVNERLTVKLDIGYSETNREEQQIVNDSRTSARKDFILVQGAHIPNITVENFDPNSYEGYNNFRTRIDTDNVRENITKAIRLDFDYALTGDTFTSVAGGIRSSELTYVQLGGNNGSGSRVETTRSYTSETILPSTGLTIADSCGISFRESDFLDRMSDGPLITNVDSNGNVIAEGTGSTFATYDNQCFSDAMIELHNANPANANNQFTTAYPEVELRNPNSINVTETTVAAYAMANFESLFLERGLRGNFGLRIVQTDVSSIGYRAPYTVITDPITGILSLDIGEGIEDVEGGGTYTEYLPSVNVVWDFDEDKIIRGGVFRGMSRVNPTDMAYNRSFNTADEDTDPMTLDELLTGANGTGNPDLKPLMSWNADLSVEWYPVDDAIFSAGVYYKKFLGGFEKRTQMETFTIDGESVELPITNDVTSEDASNLLGLEFTAAYRWDLGIGVKMGYNWADTDFEVEDSLYGDTYTIGLDGVRTQLTDGIVAPASVPGFSEHSFTGQVYYQIGELDVGVIYKYRSDYFQPSTTNSTRLRYIHSVGTWEARASYNITDNVKVKVEGINLFSAPKKQDYFEQGNLGEVNDYGPRIFAGVTVKF
ncbi:TonB-dependent receptor [Simiduia curdlanivorans]|uniref:TonB-dependent receptor n=1 Tax=Simiduia curdlanivorans TaxID=1492769 RepID=A0ABV8V6I4_9GAMM|nr:TonB-dependent receptor [Simiduia curdlanivorans]MDN3638270.1 TonB-dependent receptor [Simiduia curdlanivorans]